LTAAEVTVDQRDFGYPELIVDTAQRELKQAGSATATRRRMENTIDRGIQVLIPSGVGKRKSTSVASDDDRAQGRGERHECFQRASDRVPIVGPCARASSEALVSCTAWSALARP
jgi:hypothetical protein